MAARAFVFLQARMGSSRFPGKVMNPIAGVPLVGHCIARFRRLEGIELVVLTSTRPRESPLVEHLDDVGVRYFRGSEIDVLRRFTEAARCHHADVVVRATADNPLVDLEAQRAVVDAIGNDCLYAYTVGYPVGVNAEAFHREGLEIAYREGTLPHHREHVNEYCLENPERFGARRLLAPPGSRLPDVRLTVDTPEDHGRIEALMLSTGTPPIDIEWYDLVARGTGSDTDGR